MTDILGEMGMLSEALQSRGLTLPRAEKFIQRSIRAFEVLKLEHGKFEDQIEKKLSSEKFSGISMQWHQTKGLYPFLVKSFSTLLLRT